VKNIHWIYRSVVSVEGVVGVVSYRHLQSGLVFPELAADLVARAEKQLQGRLNYLYTC
jgi:hypothetical protein